MKYCLTTLYDSSFSSFSTKVTKSFEIFCKINECDLITFNQLFDNSLHPSWNKLFAVKKCFESYDGVLWCDADSLFIGNPNNFFQENVKNENFITNSDPNGICLSHFFMKNTKYNVSLIDTLLFLKDVKDDLVFGVGKKWEQNALKALTNNFKIDVGVFKEHTVVDFIWHGKSYDTTYFYHFSNLENHVRHFLINFLTDDESRIVNY
jgi:hypothetical protein